MRESIVAEMEQWVVLPRWKGVAVIIDQGKMSAMPVRDVRFVQAEIEEIRREMR